MRLFPATPYILILWAAFGVPRVDSQCSITHQSHNNKQVRCQFTPSASQSSRPRRPGTALPSTVTLSRGIMTSIPSDATKLDLSDSKIRDIRVTAFTGFSAVRQLDLSYNQMSSLKAGSFEGLTDLVHLNVSNNVIKHLGVGTFSGNSKLQVLDLTKNMLSRLDWGVFNNMGSLQYLILAKNTLSSQRLNENAMGGLTGMIYVDFTANDMNAGPSTMLQAMSKLEVLILRKCSLQGIPQYVQNTNLKSVKHLVVAQNEISTIENNAFSALVSLEVLDLSENGLETVNSEVLYPLRNLKQISLNRNRITTISSNIFRNSVMLQLVDLSHNDIKCLSGEFFRDTNKLNTLNVAYNSLIDIGEGFDKTLQSLQRFYINHNPWNCRTFKRLLKIMNIRKVDYGRHNFDGRSVVCKKYARQYEFCST